MRVVLIVPQSEPADTAANLRKTPDLFLSGEWKADGDVGAEEQWRKGRGGGEGRDPVPKVCDFGERR